MDNKYKVVISNRNLYKEAELPIDAQSYRIGTTVECDYRLQKELFFEEIRLDFINQDGKWKVMCSDNVYISEGDTRRFLTTELKHGKRIFIKYQESDNDVFAVDFSVDFDSKSRHFERRIDISNMARVTIGSDDENDIVVHSQYIGNDKIELIQDKDGFMLNIINVTYGLYRNGNMAENKEILMNGDFIAISDIIFYFKDGGLWTEITDNCRVRNLTYRDFPKKSAYPMFIRNTRLKSENENTPIKILDPSAVPEKPELNIVTSLMPAIVMFVLVVVLRGIMSTSGGAFVLFSICSMGLGVVTSVISIFDKKKKYEKECQERENVYLNYIENKKAEIYAARSKELECMRSMYYSTEEDLQNIENFSPCLFDRIPQDDDFLDVYLGIGTTAAARKIDYKQQEKMEIGDNLSFMPSRISEEYKYIDNAPVILKMKEANAVGIIGGNDALYEMMKCILADIISRQYYSDVSIFVLLDGKDKKYEWIRMLPHIQCAGQRNIVCDNESKNNIFENLYKNLAARENLKGEMEKYNIILIQNEQGIKSHPISRFVKKASELNTVFLFFENSKDLLPLYCSQVVELCGYDSARLYQAGNKTDIQEFKYTHVSDAEMARAASILAPVYCEEISLEGALRKSISLFELLGIYSIEDLDLGQRWNKSKVFETMAVPLGINVKDDIVYLDLHEKYHGPHGLVAGTTGSGKSEILQTYILGAATLFHPYEIGFMIIDFKGGGMVNQFKNLPHLIGAITNIDGKAIERSLKSLKAELLKRQNLFAEAEVNHIDKYIVKFKQKEVSVALPHLIIIVDEFAELKAEQPEFMKELISAARIGRSLGVHLILATQKPAGQVNEQIWSNSKFKLCLKVQTQEDSNEVLKSPLAAEIREPGRAYLQVGNNEIFELLQSGYSGSPEKNEESTLKKFEICEVDFKGTRKAVYKQHPKKQGSTRTQLEAIVEYVEAYCKKSHISKLPEICLPALSETIICNPKKYCFVEGGKAENVIGIYDDPDCQCQGGARVSVETSNIMIIGSAQYGKTNLLEVIIRNLAEIYTPEELNIYIIDFASMVLKNFEKLAHVGGIVCPADDEKLKNLFKFLADQISYRKEHLLSVGVSSYSAYKEAGYSDIPQIVVMVDNLTVLKELYLQDNDVLLNICREGVSVGISVIISNMQTSGLGYRYLSNFATRIALFCNEPSEYSSVFGSCKIQPEEVPGRCIVEIDKALYECQTFLAFEGEREIERIHGMQAFIAEMNHLYDNMHALPIPEIPDILGEDYMFDNYLGSHSFPKFLIGLGYDTVMPVTCDVFKNNLLALSGEDDSGKSNFILYFSHAMQRKLDDIDWYVFDDYRKKLAPIKEKGTNTYFEIGSNQYKEALINLELQLNSEYQEVIAGSEIQSRWRILILNNEDVVSAISCDKVALETVKNMIGKYKMLNVFVILGNVPNAQITYGSMELYKMVKETKNILFFDNLENCKLVDVPLNVLRNNKKKIQIGDAYYLSGNECYKVKTPLAVK